MARAILALLPLILLSSGLFAQNPYGTTGSTSYASPSSSSVELQPYDKLGKDNVVVKAHYVSGGSVFIQNWEGIGSYGSEIEAIKVVQVIALALGVNRGPISVEFYFAMRDVRDGDLYFEGQVERSDVDAGTWIFSTIARRADDRMHGYWNTRRKAGAKLVGWFVRVIRDNAIVGIAGSSPGYERTAADPKSFSLAKVNAK